MVLAELPNHLLALGVAGAINLDGGGSSALHVLEEPVFNQFRPNPVAFMIQQEN